MIPDKLTADDLAAMIRGANTIVATLAKVFPSAGPEELLDKARQIEGCPAALELLHIVLTAQKIRLGG